MVELITSFAFGLILGSFLNVIILRADNWGSIVSGRSKCPNCHKQLRWYDLIPIVSYVQLQGRCRYCKKPISWQYPLVELLMAALTAGAWCLVAGAELSPASSVVSLAALILSFALMIVLAAHDFREQMVPDLLSYLLVGMAFIFGWIFTGSLVLILLGGLVAVLPIALLVYPSKEKWMGAGDIPIALALGLLVGYPNVIAMLAVAFIGGGLFGGILLGLGRVKPTTSVPFAPILFIAAILTLFWGNYLVRWYMNMTGLG